MLERLKHHLEEGLSARGFELLSDAEKEISPTFPCSPPSPSSTLPT